MMAFMAEVRARSAAALLMSASLEIVSISSLLFIHTSDWLAMPCPSCKAVRTRPAGPARRTAATVSTRRTKAAGPPLQAAISADSTVIPATTAPALKSPFPTLVPGQGTGRPGLRRRQQPRGRNGHERSSSTLMALMAHPVDEDAPASRPRGQPAVQVSRPRTPAADRAPPPSARSPPARRPPCRHARPGSATPSSWPRWTRADHQSGPSGPA